MNKASINEVLSLGNEDMKEEMMGVMKEFLRLAKINPNTMMSEKQPYILPLFAIFNYRNQNKICYNYTNNNRYTGCL